MLVSQSGRTGEALGLQKTLRLRNPLIVLTNNQESELAESAQFVLPLFAMPDGGVALKTYTASLAVLLMLAAEVCGQSAARVAESLLAHDPMERAIKQSEGHLEAMLDFAHASEYVTLLGRGPSIASALGGALLLKETAKLPVEGANAGQFRHGAIEVVTQGSLVVLFAPRGQTNDLNLQLTAQLENSGARVLLIGTSDGPRSAQRMVAEIKSPDEYFAPVFEIVPLQLLSYGLALRRGIQPGTFLNTTPVVVTR